MTILLHIFMFKHRKPIHKVLKFYPPEKKILVLTFEKLTFSHCKNFRESLKETIMQTIKFSTPYMAQIYFLTILFRVSFSMIGWLKITDHTSGSKNDIPHIMFPRNIYYIVSTHFIFHLKKSSISQTTKSKKNCDWQFL